MTRPTFSILVPTHNRPERLSTCLEAIAGLDYPRDRFEVVVVDDGTEPDSAVPSVVEQHLSGIDTFLLRQKQAGPGSARNAGARLATKEFLAFTDDDCRPRPGWLEGFARVFRENPNRMLAGRTENELTGNVFSVTSQILATYVCDYFEQKGQPLHISNNFAVPRSLFEETGGFDPRFHLAGGEDRELSDRYVQAGVTMSRAPEAVVDHAHRLNFRSFVRQHQNYGRGAYIHHRVRAERRSGDFQIEPIRFYLDLIATALRSRPRGEALQVTPLLVLSQVANAVGFFQERGRQKRTQARQNPTG